MRVNDELVLEAGTCEEFYGPHGPQRLIRPPETTLFHQVLDYLTAKPDPPKRPSGSMVVEQGTRQGRQFRGGRAAPGAPRGVNQG